MHRLPARRSTTRTTAGSLSSGAVAVRGIPCRSRREDTPLREFTSRDRATFGGNFTSRWTWCRAVHTGCRYLVTKTKWPCNTDTPRLSVECPLLSHKT